MKLQDLKPAKGSRKRRKIIGRGPGSGHGLYATKGIKGQNARSGGGTRPGFEGGQMPLYRRIPKRGFKNRMRKSYCVVNVGSIAEKFDAGSEITPGVLIEKKLIRKSTLPIKVLGEGDVGKALKIKVHAFSKSAQEKVTKAGGTIEVIEKGKPEEKK
ncbi:MAG: 50S ribosomal protein L15 [bacterium]